VKQNICGQKTVLTSLFEQRHALSITHSLPATLVPVCFLRAVVNTFEPSLDKKKSGLLRVGGRGRLGSRKSESRIGRKEQGGERKEENDIYGKNVR
jgi:hypothetical protein